MKLRMFRALIAVGTVASFVIASGAARKFG